MECYSCGTTVPIDADCCGQCGEPIGRGQVTTHGARGGVSSDCPLVPDGGQPPSDDDESEDPLADRSDDAGDEPDEEYLEPGEIVDDEDPEPPQDDGAGSAGQPPNDQPADQPRGGQPPEGPPDDQPPTDQPSDGQPTDQPRGGQPPEGPPDDQPRGGQPPEGPPDDQPRGGQPTDQPPTDQPRGGQPTEGPADDRPPTGAGGQGDPTGEPGAPLGGEGAEGTEPAGQPGQAGQPSQAGQPGQAGQPAGAGQPTGAAGAGQTGQAGQVTEEGSLVDELRKYPLKLGTALGMIAFLIPYLLLTLATFWAWEQSPGEDTSVEPGGWEVVDGSASWSQLDVSAELFFEVIELGSGGAIVDLFRRSAGVAPPRAVDPSDYPTAEDQLEPLLQLLAFDAVPDVPLLILFAIAPYILFISGRYLARNYTPGETLFEYVVAGSTVTIGTVIVALLLSLVFPVTDFAARFLFAGLILPGVIGTIGGVSVWAFDDHSALVSSLTAWTSMALGIGIGLALLPIPDLGLPDGAGLSIGILERLVIGLGAYLNALQFNIGSHSMGRLFFLVVVVLTIGAGFVRTYQARDTVTDRMDGARVGSSIFLGFLTTIALFLWVFPMGTVLVDLELTGSGFGSSWILGVEGEAVDGAGGAVIPTIETVTSVDSYFYAIFVAGIIFPMTFGALGGYLAIWYRDR